MSRGEKLIGLFEIFVSQSLIKAQRR